MTSQTIFSRFFALWERTRPAHVWLWLGVHLLVAGLFLLGGSIRVNTELTAILPDGHGDPAVAAADRQMGANSNGGLYVLVGNADFATARADALALADAVKRHGGLESLNVAVDGRLLGDFQDYLFANRYRLLPAATLAALEKGDSQSIAADAWQTMASPFAVGALARIDQDPFLLANRSLQAYLGSGLLNNMAVGIKDGVLAARHDGIWYVLATGRTRDGGVVTQAEGHIVPALRAAAERLRQVHPGTGFIWSGIPFHAYDNSVKTQSEIETITKVAMSATVLLLLLTFFSLLPLVSTLATMLVGVGFGLAATFACFHEVHIFTIVFGASVIGISLDYSLYYFSERLSPAGTNDGASIIRRSLPGITLALATTLISYGAFGLVRFPLLQQMAVFSAMGLLSTFLTVTLLYPRLPTPRRLRPGYAIAFANALLRLFRWFFRRPAVLRWGLLVLLAAATVFGLARLQAVHDIRTIYKVTPELAASEKSAAAILQHGSSGMYYLVRGKSAEEVLEREEALCARLDAGIADAAGPKLGAFAATSLLLPSAQRQDRTWRLVGDTLLPALDAQMQLLGFDATAAAAVRAGWQAQAGRHIDPESFFKLPLASLTRSLWIGQVGGEWFSAVLLLKVKDKAWLKQLETLPGVYLINKVDDLSATMRSLSQTALLALAGAYLVIFLILVWLYRLRPAIRLFAIPLAASLMTLGILGLIGVPFNLFVVMGLIMVPGIGSDYAIFFKESGPHKVVTMLAVFECMFGTVMSFGSLGFSAIAGTFGLTVGLGVAISFFLAPLTMERKTWLDGGF